MNSSISSHSAYCCTVARILDKNLPGYDFQNRIDTDKDSPLYRMLMNNHYSHNLFPIKFLKASILKLGIIINMK